MNFRFFVIALIASGLLGCGQTIAPTAVETQSETEIRIPEVEIYKPQALMWEYAHPEGRFWSSLTYRLVDSVETETLFEGPEDIEDFCPTYGRLSRNEKINFWSFLISAIAKYESDFQPLAIRTDQDGQIDALTRKTQTREGLLQISYGLGKQNRFCDFDWESDQKLPENDLRRSTLNPVLNLTCGIHILSDQVAKHQRIAHPSSFWKSLKPSHKDSAIAAIQSATRGLFFCRL